MNPRNINFICTIYMLTLSCMKPLHVHFLSVFVATHGVLNPKCMIKAWKLLNVVYCINNRVITKVTKPMMRGSYCG